MRSSKRFVSCKPRYPPGICELHLAPAGRHPAGAFLYRCYVCPRRGNRAKLKAIYFFAIHLMGTTPIRMIVRVNEGGEEISDGRVSIEEIKLAIATTAYCMKRHNMPELLPALKRFEGYLEQRLAEGDAMDHADRALAKYAKVVGNDNAPKLIEFAKAA